MILRVQVGSGVHGTSVSGQDDRDEMGICLEPREFVTGLARVPRGIDGEGEVEFEQYQRHTVWDEPGAQVVPMLGESGAHTNRPELVAVHGCDTKFAMHALRLGAQGVELLRTGRITLPVPEPHLSFLRSVRRGEVSLPEVLQAVDASDAELAAAGADAAVPDEPDRAWVDDWLHRSHVAFWDEQ